MPQHSGGASSNPMPEIPTATGKPEHFFGLPPSPSLPYYLECWGCRALVHSPRYEPGRVRIEGKGVNRRQVHGPSRKVDDGSVDFLGDRQSTRNPSNDDRITEEFRTLLNGAERGKGLLHRIAERGPKMQEEERAEWQETMPDGSIVTIQLRRASGYLYCGATRRRASIGHRVMMALRKLGIDATYEYPGFVLIAVTPHLGWSFGTVNGIWEGDLVDSGQGAVHAHAPLYLNWTGADDAGVGWLPIPASMEGEEAPGMIADAILHAITPLIDIRDERGENTYRVRTDELATIIAILGWTCVNDDRCQGLSDLDRTLIRRLNALPSLPIPEQTGAWLDRHRVATQEAGTI
jgi:hypothetical protein